MLEIGFAPLGAPFCMLVENGAVIPTYRTAFLRPGCDMAAGGGFVTGHLHLGFFYPYLLTCTGLLPISKQRSGTLLVRVPKRAHF